MILSGAPLSPEIPFHATYHDVLARVGVVLTRGETEAYCWLIWLGVYQIAWGVPQFIARLDYSSQVYVMAANPLACNQGKGARGLGSIESKDGNSRVGLQIGWAAGCPNWCV